MSLVEPGTGRATIENLGAEMHITIPVKKRAFMLLFLPVWLVGWAVGMVMVPLQLDKAAASGQKGFLVVWLVMWAIGGAVAIAIFLWNLVGKEIIVATHQLLSVEKNLLGLHRRRQYDISQTKEWRVVTDADTGSAWIGSRNPWGWSGGTIAFDYGLKTVKFGIFLEEAEGRYIIDELKRHGYVRVEVQE